MPAGSGPSDEVLKLRDEITQEVNGDAQHLATSIFGDTAKMPDMARVDDATLEARFRQAYQTEDRQWLHDEAVRDPEQFVTVARRIGVVLPDELGQTPLEQPAPALPVPPAPVVPPPMPAPLPLPVAPSAALPPTVPIAQPGQPLPPSVPPAPGY